MRSVGTMCLERRAPALSAYTLTVLPAFPSRANRLSDTGPVLQFHEGRQGSLSRCEQGLVQASDRRIRAMLSTSVAPRSQNSRPLLRASKAKGAPRVVLTTHHSISPGGII